MIKSLTGVSKATALVVLAGLLCGLPDAQGQTKETPRTDAFKSIPANRVFAASVITDDDRQSGGKTGSAQQATQAGSIPGSTPPFPTLTPGEKMRYGLRQAFLRPGPYIGPAFAAGFRQFNEADVPAKTGSDKFADYLSDYARSFGTATTTEIFASGIYPALFKQNPKYVKLKDLSGGRASKGARFWYAVSSVAVTVGDNNRRQVNYSRLGGNFTGAALANLWERDTPNERNSFGVVTDSNRRRGAGATFRRFGISIGFAALFNVLEEFSGFGR